MADNLPQPQDDTSPEEAERRAREVARRMLTTPKSKGVSLPAGRLRPKQGGSEDDDFRKETRAVPKEPCDSID